jgi:hypothetical protein
MPVIVTKEKAARRRFSKPLIVDQAAIKAGTSGDMRDGGLLR